jgi:hypothetical protein
MLPIVEDTGRSLVAVEATLAASRQTLRAPRPGLLLSLINGRVASRVEVVALAVLIAILTLALPATWLAGFALIVVVPLLAWRLALMRRGLVAPTSSAPLQAHPAVDIAKLIGVIRERLDLVDRALAALTEIGEAAQKPQPAKTSLPTELLELMQELFGEHRRGSPALVSARVGQLPSILGRHGYRVIWHATDLPTAEQDWFEYVVDPTAKEPTCLLPAIADNEGVILDGRIAQPRTA